MVDVRSERNPLPRNDGRARGSISTGASSSPPRSFVLGIPCRGDTREVELPVGALTSAAFGDFGQVLEAPAGDEGLDIGTGVFWDSVLPTGGDGGAAGLIRYRPRDLRIHRMERHSQSGQTFVSLSPSGALLVVAPDADGTPDLEGLALFSVVAGAGFRLEPGTWHASPFPLGSRAHRFLVLMREGTITEGTDWHEMEPPITLEPVWGP